MNLPYKMEIIPDVEEGDLLHHFLNCRDVLPVEKP